MGFIELFKRIAIMFITHRYPSTEPIPPPTFLTVNEDRILTSVGCHLNYPIFWFRLLARWPAMPRFLAITVHRTVITVITDLIRVVRFTNSRAANETVHSLLASIGSPYIQAT